MTKHIIFFCCLLFYQLFLFFVFFFQQTEPNRMQINRMSPCHPLYFFTSLLLRFGIRTTHTRDCRYFMILRAYVRINEVNLSILLLLVSCIYT